MRVALTVFVIVIGTMIGASTIQTFNEMQDSKLQRFCKSIPIDASYDELCKDFR